MGQRFQALAIAQVVPYDSPDGRPKYRCIAIYDRAWCCNSMPLRATRRFITLIQQKYNARIVQAEVKNIQRKYGRHLQEPILPDIPCPFTASMLGIAFSANKYENEPDEVPYLSGAYVGQCVCSADLGAWDGLNDDGISIIDVTNPQNPSYCFIRKPRAPLLDAHGYFPDNPSVVATFKGVALLTEGPLSEAWPWSSESFAEEPAHCASTDVAPSASEWRTIPTLADLTFDSALDQAIASNDTHAVDMLLSDSTKARRVRAYLRRQRPFPSSAIGLLTACLREDLEELDAPAVDLSGYDLFTEQVVQLLASHPTEIEVLNLCFNERITAGSIPQILAVAPSVRRLLIIGCTSIEETELFDMLRTKPELFFQLEALIYPSLMRFTEPLTQPIAFTIACSSSDMKQWSGCCLPVFTPTSVVQSFIDFTDFYTRSRLLKFNYYGGMAAQASFTATRKADQPFDHRSFITVPYFPNEAVIPVATGVLPSSWTCIFQSADHDDHAKGSYALYAFLKNTHQPSEAFTKSSVNAETLHEQSSDKLTQTTLAVKAYDLHGFIDSLMAEGRPPITEDSVATLSQRLLSEEESQRRRQEASIGKPKYVLFMTQAQIDHFTRNMVDAATRHGPSWY